MTAVTTVKNLDDTLKQLNETKSAAHENLKMLEQIEANIKTLQESTAHGLVVHNGKVLVQVERKAREGDFVVFEGLSTVLTTNDKFYEVCKPHGTPMYYDDESYIRDVYAWLECPEPKVKVYEVIGSLPQYDVVAVEKKCKHLTANQKRARAIQMAKDFVDEKVLKYGNDYDIDTVVNAQKRKVKVWQNVDGHLLKGKAKCKKGEVFNAHIGEAIALAKALDIVEQLPPDILKAVQPELAVGQKIVDEHGVVSGIALVSDPKNFSLEYVQESHFKNYKIIDDTNADYSLQGGEN